MIDFGPLDELREIRRRLSEQCGNDINRYAAMLADVAKRIPGTYLTQQQLSEMVSPPSHQTPNPPVDTQPEMQNLIANRNG